MYWSILRSFNTLIFYELSESLLLHCWQYISEWSLHTNLVHFLHLVGTLRSLFRGQLLQRPRFAVVCGTRFSNSCTSIRRFFTSLGVALTSSRLFWWFWTSSTANCRKKLRLTWVRDLSVFSRCTMSAFMPETFIRWKKMANGHRL